MSICSPEYRNGENHFWMFFKAKKDNFLPFFTLTDLKWLVVLRKSIDCLHGLSYISVHKPNEITCFNITTVFPKTSSEIPRLIFILPTSFSWNHFDWDAFKLTDTRRHPAFQGQRRHPESQWGGRQGRDPQPSGGGPEGGGVTGAALRPQEETGFREGHGDQAGERTQR